ncbi:hypothetical protein HYFRA_00000607 [Hymenoscyphus fraxineus]|uniref:NACHT domain-containing protein n=1 Tax=Hymenoscyphus fraxineus TaxID=746836 RepID=A0A9N9PWW9_9HELO|nr:hypothetical protein HYFRA_00000607 [Hymenoscyphus fraxineus]
MTGLESFAALGIACNVMQVISFGHEIISTCKQIYLDGSSDDGLSSIANNLDDASSTLRKSLRNLPQSATEDETKLIQMAKECSEASAKVQAVVNKYSSKKGGKLEAVKLGVQKIWNKRDLEKAEKVLKECQAAMENRILVRICTKQDALSLINDQNFQTLDQTLKTFIEQRSRDFIKLEDLINTNTVSVKETVVEQREIADKHVARQHVDTQNLVHDESNKTRQQFLDTAAVQIDRMQREKLLGGLNFSGRNERLNDIKEAHYESFEWLFGTSKKSDMAVNSSDSTYDTTKESLVVDGQTRNGENIYDQGDDDWVLENLVEETRVTAWASFSGWLSSGNQIYWIGGKAGAGKSTLMRFLHSNPKTSNLLNKEGMGNTILLWHFFYLMGNSMQHSIKGLLCSLLHQLLGSGRKGNELIVHLLKQNPSAVDKKYDTDWSEKELRSSLFDILRVVSQTQRLCIFLDGLDEIYADDGADKLLKLIEDVCAISTGNVKLCISSREEVVFKKRFGSRPSLRLQHLTAPDIYRYALSQLAGFDSQDPLRLSQYHRWSHLRLAYFYPNPSQLFAETIVQKSEGVFLWGYLAIESLKRARSNTDNAETIQQRLEEMPKHLKNLYASMWKRLNDDEKLYEAEAALYFNLVIEYSDQRLTTDYATKDKIRSRKSREPTLCHISIAREVISACDRGRPLFVSPLESIGTSCQTHYQGIQVRCAGLLEFTHKGSDKIPQPGNELLYADMEVGFIHRTAKEFLRKTAEGRNILNKDKISSDLRLASIIHSWLLRCWTGNSPKYNDGQKLHFSNSKLNATWYRELCYSYLKLPEATKQIWVGSWHSIQENMPRHCFSQGIRHVDVLFRMAHGCLHDFVSISFRQPDMYTAHYKALLLKSAAAGLQDFVIYNEAQREVLVDEWLKTIEFLLSQGCEPQYSHPPISVSYNTIVELLITFYWKLPGSQQPTLYVKRVERKILEILQKLISNKFDMNQEVYAFVAQGAIRGSDGSFLEKVTIKPPSGGMRGNLILLKLPVGELLRRLSQSMAHTYLGKGITEILSSWTPEEPEILAIGFGSVKNWSKSARRVDKDLERQLLEVIMRENPTLDTNVVTIQDQIQREIDDLIEGYDYDGVEPEDLTEYLLIDRGLQEKYRINCPETLKHWLRFVLYDNAKIWMEVEERRDAMPTKFLSDAEFEEEDHTLSFELLWGSD